jgi:AcrR family transcriptional regulator
MARPRSVKAHEQVLKATLKLIADRGIDATSVDAIAEESGVSKATIYKHWDTKEALCLEAISRVSGHLPLFDCGNPRTDLTELVRYVAHGPETKALRRIWPRVMSHAMGHLAFARALRARFDEPRRVQVSRIIKSAISKGQLRPKIDIDLALDLLFGPVIHRYFANIPMPPDLPDRVVDAFWRIHARSTAAPTKLSTRFEQPRSRAASVAKS